MEMESLHLQSLVWEIILLVFFFFNRLKAGMLITENYLVLGVLQCFLIGGNVTDFLSICHVKRAAPM